MPDVDLKGIPPLVQPREAGQEIALAGATQELAPPQARDFPSLTPWPMTLDEVLQMALANSPVIRDFGGRVLAAPQAVRTTLDPAVVASDPNLGPQAALAAFDTQFETGVVWNGGGRPVNSAFSSGQFGVFSQPTTLARVGLGRVFHNGTKVTVAGFGGYDEELAGGPFGAYGGEVRHPLLRGAGREFNDVAGPLAKPGMYRGVLLAQLDERKAQLELEQAVRDLARDVSFAYWELSFAYQNLVTKQAALENARQTLHREQQRAAARVTPADHEALARMQFHAAEAAVQNAIGGAAGVYLAESRLRTLLTLPICDGRLIRPSAQPLEAELRFDWQDTVQMAQARRVELRKQLASIQQREMELRASRNLWRPQLDAVGQYRRLADDPTNPSATFTETLQGWQLGLEYSQALGRRREDAAVRNAELRLIREHALLNEQRRHVASELHAAFTELDRAFATMRSFAVGREAARISLQAESQRHAAGETHIDRVLQAQVRQTEVDTAFQRSLVDYNLAFIKVHFARGSLLETLGVAFDGNANDEYRFAHRSPSAFAYASERRVARDAIAPSSDTAPRSSRLPAVAEQHGGR